MRPREKKDQKRDRSVSLPSPYAAKREFSDGLKILGDGWKRWTLIQCVEAVLALRQIVEFRETLLREPANQRGVIMSVTAAARMLNMHRASVHRYLKKAPSIRNSRGKVILPRLINAIANAKKLESRGRRTIFSPKRPRLNNLPGHLRPFRQTLVEFHAWRVELGAAWMKFSREDCRDIAECFASTADFVGKLNKRAVRIIQASATPV